MKSAALAMVAGSKCGIAEFGGGKLRSAKISSPEVRNRRQRCERQQSYGYLCAMAPVHRRGHNWGRATVDIERNELKVRKERSMVETLKSRKVEKFAGI